VTTDDDIAKLSELCRKLVTPDLEPPAAQRIAQRAIHDLGKGPSARRFVEPVIAAAVVVPYAVWVIFEVLKFLH
jgi:hypothetical protein